MTLEIGLDIRRNNEGLVRIPFCIGVGLALLAGPALAQKTERPEVKVGDRWQFVRYYSVASTKPNLIWEINSVTETEISGTENGEPLRMTPDLNVVDSPERKQSNPKALSFPLGVGKSWRFAKACALLRSELERYHLDRGRGEVRVVGHGFHDGARCCSIPIRGRDHRVVLAVNGRCAAHPAFRHQLERLELARRYRDCLVRDHFHVDHNAPPGPFRLEEPVRGVFVYPHRIL